MKAVLESAGCTMNHILKTTIYLEDIRDFKEINEIYSEYFTAPYPARATVQVSGLPLGARVEIEAMARMKEE